jgi:uncharacterized protein YegP (UPF0339 family)
MHHQVKKGLRADEKKQKETSPMRKTVLSGLLLVILASTAVAQSGKCPCDNTPFKPDPPCGSECIVGLVATVGIDDLMDIIGVGEETARRITDWPYRRNAQSLKDYRIVLSDGEISELAAKINSLSKDQLRYLNKKRERSEKPQLVSRENGRTTVPMFGIAQTDKKDTILTYTYYENSRGEWHWYLQAPDGRTIAKSAAAYKTEAACLTDIKTVQHSAKAKVSKQ